MPCEQPTGVCIGFNDLTLFRTLQFILHVYTGRETASEGSYRGREPVYRVLYLASTCATEIWRTVAEDLPREARRLTVELNCEQKVYQGHPSRPTTEVFTNTIHLHQGQSLIFTMAPSTLLALLASSSIALGSPNKRQDGPAMVDFSQNTGTPKHSASGILYGLPDDQGQMPRDLLSGFGFNYCRAAGAQVGNGWSISRDAFQICYAAFAHPYASRLARNHPLSRELTHIPEPLPKRPERLPAHPLLRRRLRPVVDRPMGLRHHADQQPARSQR